MMLWSLAFAEPAGTGFTFQGQLTNGASPASGAHDFIFRAFAVEAGGSELGSSAANSVNVAGGIFSAQIDFGPGVVTGEALWLEIAVRATGDANPHVTLAPRQKITPAPMAIIAGNSLSLGGVAADDYATDTELAAATGNLLAAPPAPAAPTHPRLLRSQNGVPWRALHWDMPSFSGVSGFFVYQSPQPIADDGRDSATQHFVSGTAFDVKLPSDSGKHYFRVAALNIAGLEGPLSRQVSADTAMRIVYSGDMTTIDVTELYMSHASGAGGAQTVNPPHLTVSDVSGVVVSPDGVHVAYTVDGEIDEKRELYVASLDNPGVAQKVSGTLPDTADVSEPAFSVDGARLYYMASFTDPSVNELFSVPTDGSAPPQNLQVVDANAGFSVIKFSVSPSGRHLAYTSGLNFAQAFILDLDTRLSIELNPPNHTIEQTSLFAPGYSPDGRFVLFKVKFASSAIADQLFSYSVDSGEYRHINPDNGGTDGVGNVMISPTGAQLLYRRDTGFPLLLSPVFAEQVAIQLALGVTNTYGFSPDGLLVFYQIGFAVDDVKNLFLAPAAGGGETLQITNHVSAFSFLVFPTFSPDGRWLVYAADKNTAGSRELFAIDLWNDYFEKRLNPPLSSGETIEFIVFSPNGEYIAYRADQDIDGVTEIFVVSPLKTQSGHKIHSALSGELDASSPQFAPIGFENRLRL